MDVAAIMPCRGRAAQTVAHVRRLLATAGDVPWRLWCVIDRDAAVYAALGVEAARATLLLTEAGSYWRALHMASVNTGATHLVNLANDLLPGRNWLARGLLAYTARFGSADAPGLMGFNDGLHGPEHSSHFLISRNLLDRYGGWPVWYQHNFGDTELCRRAQRDGLYGKAAWAVLYHDHLETGADDDAVYREGRASYDADARLFEERREAGWPPVRSVGGAPRAMATGAAASADWRRA
jgi:hypothetical protein